MSSPDDPPPSVDPFAAERIERKPDVGAEGFFALDLRVGQILEVEDFPEARVPAWKLKADFGPAIGTLRTSAQVRNYGREELVGRKIVGAINLGTKRIAGFTSEFLVLGSVQPDGTVYLLEVDDRAALGAPIA